MWPARTSYSQVDVSLTNCFPMRERTIVLTPLISRLCRRKRLPQFQWSTNRRRLSYSQLFEGLDKVSLSLRWKLFRSSSCDATDVRRLTWRCTFSRQVILLLSLSKPFVLQADSNRFLCPKHIWWPPSSAHLLRLCTCFAVCLLWFLVRVCWTWVYRESEPSVADTLKLFVLKQKV